MKRLLYIFGIILLIGAVSSCAKDELEAPSESESTTPQAISIDGDHGVKGGNQLDAGHDIILRSGTGEDDDGEVDINDDGDNEEEDRSPQKE